MLKTIRAMVAVVLALGFASLAQAQLDTKKLFFGAGLSQNDLSGFDKGTGFQFFGGYEFGQVAPKINADVEVGYMDSGNMKGPQACTPAFPPFIPATCFGAPDTKIKGLWATGVARYMVTPTVELLGRAGLDFGDDDGLMFGIGAGYLVSKGLKLRLELVERDHLSSMQFNAVFKF